MAAKPWIVIPLELPVGDKTYTVQPVEYDVGLTLLRAGDKGSKIPPKSEDRVLFELVLGATWDQMLEDKQSYPVMFRAGVAALQYQTALVSGFDSEAAVTIGEQVWEHGLSPEAVAAALKEVAAANSKESNPSTSTASASKTPSRVSTRTTTSRKTTPRIAAAKKAPRSTGTK